MEDWQGEGKKPRKRKRRPDRDRQVPSSAPQPADVPADSWQGKRGKQNLSADTSGQPQEGWNWIPERIVNWLAVAWHAKLWLTILLVVGLSAILVWIALQKSKKTHVVIIKPERSSKLWLGSTPFLDLLDQESFSANEDLKVRTDYIRDAVDDTDWSGVPMGGPDRDIVVFYISGTGIATATPDDRDKREDEVRPRPFLFGKDISPYDYLARPLADSFELQRLLDRIAKTGDQQAGKKLVIIDAHSFESPTNPGLLPDGFPQAVKELYQADEGQKYGNLIVVVSHRPGDKNWPMPERRSSAFGYCAELALQGAADGALDGQHDNKVTFDEFCRFVGERVNEYVKRKYDCTQRPMILAPEKTTDFYITDCPSVKSLQQRLEKNPARAPTTTVADQYELNKKWAAYGRARERLTEDPMLAARSASVLARMEQLCITYTADFSGELETLNSEWKDNIEREMNRKKTSEVFRPISLREQAWLEHDNSSRLLPSSDVEKEKLQELFETWRKVQELPDEPAAKDEPETAEESPAETAGNPETDAETSQPAADGAALEKQDPKKVRETYQELLKQYQAQPRHWHLAWKLWETCVESAGQAKFAFTAKELADWLEKIDNPMVRNMMEIKYLQLLADNIDWDDAENQVAIEQCLRLCVACRNMSEELLVSECNDLRSLVWIFEDIEDLDNQIRVAEDHFFAGEYEVAISLLENARGQLETRDPYSLRWKANLIREAYDIRDRVFHDAPWYGALIARHISRSPIPASILCFGWYGEMIVRQMQRDEEAFSALPSTLSLSNLESNWLSMVEDNHTLSELLTTRPAWSDIDEIVRLSAQVKLTLEKRFETRIREFVTYLLKSKGTTVVVCAPDLLVCPVPMARRDDLRQKYFVELSGINEDIRIGVQVKESDTEVSSLQAGDRLDQFLVNARAASLPGVFKSPQNAVSEKPFFRNWLWSRIEKQELDRVADPFVNDQPDPTESEDYGLSESPIYEDMVKFDYWIRSAAATLAENEGKFHDAKIGMRDARDDPYAVFRGISNDLFVARWAQYIETRVRRTTRDFWGNNDQRAKQPYYESVAEQLIRRFQTLEFEGEFNKGFASKRLPQRCHERLAEYRFGLEPDNFRIVCPDFSYRAAADSVEPHSVRVQAGAAWTELSNTIVEANNEKLRPTIAMQFQPTTRDKIIPVTSDRQVTRRFSMSLGPEAETESSKEFRFQPETLEKDKYARVTSVMAFRGHLRSTSLSITEIKPDAPVEITTVKLPPHQPDRFQLPEVTVVGEKLVTDVIFVIDCSGSMKQSFVLGRSDGLLEPDVSSNVNSASRSDSGKVDRFEKSKFFKMREILINLLQPASDNSRANNRWPGLDPRRYRVGVVAIGSQVNFGPSTNPYDLRGPDDKKVDIDFRPFEDVRLVTRLTPLTDVLAVNKMIEDLKKLRPCGYTPLYQGMLTGAKELLDSPRADPQNTKLIVALTDGVEFTREYPAIMAQGKRPQPDINYGKLVTIRNEHRANLQFEFVGFDLPKQSKFQNELEGRRKQLEELCGDHFTVAGEYAEIADQLQKIAKVRHFMVTEFANQGSEAAPASIEFEQPWSPPQKSSDGQDEDLKNQRFRPGLHTVAVNAADLSGVQTSRNVFLYGNENLRFRFDGRSLLLDKRTGNLPGERKTAFIEKGSPYDVFMLNPRALQFAFLNRDPDELSVRPNRVCLQAVSVGGDVVCTLQDVNFDQRVDLGVPVATFHAPAEMPTGDYTFRLWFQPFDENRVDAEGESIDRNFLENVESRGRESWKIREASFGKIKARIYGFQNKQTLTVELTVQDANDASLLRDVLVDVKTRSAENVWTTDFYTKREYSDVLMVPEGASQPKVESISLKCTFELNDKYGDKQVVVSVKSVKDVFEISQMIEFQGQIGK